VGRLSRATLCLVLLAPVLLASPPAVAAFDRFGPMTADATYGVSIDFEVDLVGGTPDELNLVLSFPEAEADFVAPVTPTGSTATYVWDVADAHLTPNTLIRYRWRGTDGAQVVVSDEGTVLYDDDRPGLDWRSEQVGEATVHWYGEAAAEARAFGEVTAVGVNQAEELLGTELAGPVDIFVYATRDDFFGALGPGAREWTGAAAFPELRTIFMWLEGGSQSYLETVIIHEVTHVVFFDATDNPYHEPARWLNEGIATWSETRSADGERETVASEAAGAGLFAFDAITAQFPIGERGGLLAYAQGTTLVETIIEDHGAEAIARMTAAYRDGSSDAEALEAGTGVPADQLYADFYAAYGEPIPQPVEPEPILPSNVELPPAAAPGDGGPAVTAAPQPAPGEPAVDPAAGSDDLLVVIVLVAAIALAGAAAAFFARRAGRAAARRP
jgi:hypothetical protein